MSATDRSLAAAFAPYAAVGRSNVHITLTATGTDAGARVTPRADGSALCELAGLRVPVAHSDSTRAARMMAGLVVHEVTHCLTSPYAGDLHRDDHDPASQAANLRVLLTLESVSDARAVIEIFRKDGAGAAADFVAMALPARLRPSSPGHSTAPALRAALQAVSRQPESVRSDVQAFALAVRVGRDAAADAFRAMLAAEHRADLASSPTMTATSAQLDAALTRAEHAFQFGRHANNAATVRLAAGVASPGDTHIFVAADGAVRTQPVLGAETAHALAELESLIASSRAPEHRLALAWLQREGRLDATTLARCRGAFSRLIGTFSDGSPAQTDQALKILGETMTQSRIGTTLPALLDNAADALKSVFDPTLQAQLTTR